MQTKFIAPVAIVLGNFVSGVAFAACPVFSAATPYAVGDSTESVSVGDFNRDGALDLAVTNHTRVSILLGNGNGTFQAPKSFSTGQQWAVSIGMGDFNRDGIIDLAVASYHPNISGVVIFLGDGNGAFVLKGGPYLGGTQPMDVAVGDFDGDGNSDLAVVNPALQKISVLMGNGKGAFLLPPSNNYGAGKAPRALAVGDVNCDGKPDIAVTNQNSGDVSILINTGGGSFAQAVHYAVGSIPLGIAIGDVSRDAKVDLIVAVSNMNKVGVLLGAGKGAFSKVTPYPASSTPSSVAIGDFDRDGNNDIAVANQSAGTVSILRGTGGGVFVSAGTLATGLAPTSVAIGDFNGDGKIDLAVANNKSNSVSIFLNTCTCP